MAGLNEIIQSHQQKRTSKCRAIFDLFENYVQPKSANDFSKIFLDHSWIDQANIQVISRLGGMIPIPWDPKNETLYVIYLFPNKNKWSDRVIYLTLTAPQLARQDLISILNGHEPSAPGIEVSAFALCGPTPADADLACKLFPPELRR